MTIEQGMMNDGQGQQPLNEQQFAEVIRQLEESGGHWRGEQVMAPAVRTLLGLSALANPETEMRIATDTVVSDGGDPYSDHYRGSQTYYHDYLVWQDEEGRSFQIRLHREHREAQPDAHTLRRMALADYRDVMQFNLAEIQTTAARAATTKDSRLLSSLQDTASLVIAQAEEGLQAYDEGVNAIQQRFEALQQLIPQLGIDADDRMILFYRKNVVNRLQARYGTEESDRVLRESISLERMRNELRTYEGQIDSEYEKRTGETLEEFERSQRGENLELPEAEVKADPRELSVERQVVQIRELLRRYRHSPTVDEQTVNTMVATLRSATGEIDYKILRYKSHKINAIEIGKGETLEQLLLDLRRLNGIEVPEQTRFDVLRDALSRVPVMDRNELQIHPDEIAFINTLIHFAELVDEGFAHETFDGDLESMVSGIDRAIQLLRFAGDRTNQSLHYRKNRRHGREALEDVISRIMHATQYAFPALQLRPDHENGSWGVYPRFRPSSGDIKRAMRNEYNGKDFSEVAAILEGAYEEQTQRLAIPPHVRKALDYIVRDAEKFKRAAKPGSIQPEQAASAAVATADVSKGVAGGTPKVEPTAVVPVPVDPAEKRISQSPYGPYRKIRAMGTPALEELRAALEEKDKRTKTEERDLHLVRIMLFLRRMEAGQIQDLPSREELEQANLRIQLILKDTATFPEAEEIRSVMAHDNGLLGYAYTLRAREDWLHDIMQLEEPSVYIAGNPALEAAFRERMTALISASGELPDVESIKNQAVAIAEELAS